MPILDPTLQIKLFELLYQVSGCNTPSYKYFFISYLEYASKNKNKNVEAIKSSIKFKQTFKENLNLINKTFDCNFTPDIFTLPIRNIYKYLYDHSKPQKKAEDYFIGANYLFDDYFQMEIFQPYVDFIEKRSWFFTNFPFAILCLSKNFSEDICQLINLEVDLMISCGCTVVLCAYFEPKNNNIDPILNVLFSHKFAEIHLNFNSQKDRSLNNILSKIINNYGCISGYLYFYSLFISNTSSQLNDNIEKVKQLPRFHFYSISKNLNKAFSVKVEKIKKHDWYIAILEKEKIAIRLFNIPLYDSEDEVYDFSPSLNVSICEAFITPRDFMYMKRTRVKILYNDKDNNRCIYKYIDFDDLHKIHLDQFIENTIYLVNSNENTLSEVDQIRKIYMTTKDDNSHQISYTQY